MMNIKSFFYVLSFVLMVSVTFRITSFVYNFDVDIDAPEIPTYAQAFAEDPHKSKEENLDTDKNPEPQKRTSSLKDPLQPRYTEAELSVLQKLSDRRAELDKREKGLDEKLRFIEAAEQRLEKKYSELSSLKQELVGLLGEQQKEQEGRMKQLVKIYESMKPKDAANIFNELEFDVLVSIIERMSERKTAPIIAAMDPNRARSLSAQLAEQKALPDPNDL